MHILAIDPGKTTGACLIETLESGFEVVTALEIPWEHRLPMLRALIDGTFLESEKPQLPEAVVIENFKLRQGRALEQSGSDFPSSQIIGSVQAFLWCLGPEAIHRLHYQEPFMMVRVQILPEHEHLVVGSEHKKDAYKHARFYYIQTQWRKVP